MTTLPSSVEALLERYLSKREQYRKPEYKEHRLRVEFVNPLFEALGWDIQNRLGYAEAYKDVIHEDSIDVHGSRKAPDYAFRIGGQRKFFVETKCPSENIHRSISSALQLRRYGWSAKLPVSILTNFEQTSIFDCRRRPLASDSASNSRIQHYTLDTFSDCWQELSRTFSKEAILTGSFDKYIDSSKRRSGTAEFDVSFLADIERWRESLAKNIVLRNPQHTAIDELNSYVQNTIDRIIFLRIAEDRGIEQYETLLRATRGVGIYDRLAAIFLAADQRYNSGLFHFDPRRGGGADTTSLTLSIDDKPLRDFITGLYPPLSPYAFKVVPADVLGQVYEQFLGKVITVKGRSATVVEKPEVRAAGGVFYTPGYIVRYIVNEVLSPLASDLRPGDLLAKQGKKAKRSLKILDPACGSGSFLIEAYQYLLDWYIGQYSAHEPEKLARISDPPIYLGPGGSWRLTVSEKRRILLNHIYGVDLDPQAVEVTKLSLLLKVLEGENESSVSSQQDLFTKRVLPDLESNIRCGNSLVGHDIYETDVEFSDDEIREINSFDWREFELSATGGEGFNAIVGNPPYVLMQDEFRQAKVEPYLRDAYESASFKLDAYHLFIEKAIRLSPVKGRIGLITPSNYMTNNYNVSLRKLMLDDGGSERIVVFQGRVFDQASVDTALYFHETGKKTDHLTMDFAVPSWDTFKVGRSVLVSKARLVSDPLRIFAAVSAEDSGLLDVMDKAGRPLGQTADVNFGKQLRDRTKFPDDVLSGQRQGFIPDGYAPCYTGSDIKRYMVEWNGLACRTSTTAQRGGCWDPEKQNATLKLLCKQVGRYPSFALDGHGYQCLNTIFMVNCHNPDDIFFVLGILNSRAISYYWLKKFYDHRVTFPKIKGTYLKKLPVPIPSAALKHSIAKHAADLTDLHEQLRRDAAGSQGRVLTTRVRTAESKLNRSVYEAFGLDASSIQKIDTALREMGVS